MHVLQMIEALSRLSLEYGMGNSYHTQGVCVTWKLGRLGLGASAQGVDATPPFPC